MNFHDIKKTDITHLKLLWRIRELKPIATKDLVDYFSYEAIDSIAAIDLFSILLSRSGISLKNPYIIQNYIDSLLTTFYQIFPNYNFFEKRYIRFLLWISAIQNILEWAQIICNEYNLLPKIEHPTPALKKMQVDIAYSLLHYYYYLNKPIDELREILEAEGE